MEWRKQVLHWITAIGLLVATSAVVAQTMIELSAGIYRIRAELATDDAARTRGLMFRDTLPANNGMLFFFEVPGRHCMWMKNTLIPLSVAFLDRQGRIINVEEMKPRTEDTHCAAGPASFALEMNAGWFKSKGLDKGSAVLGIDKAVSTR